eukprot:CAMPEP_0113648874 /NCGR_PEP_ID=MMETSP0017_2-20120614/25951_1 /TAXON_ID=2856 /ORGANISM="Cylindrotheca closterium" /LENGTH=241 /DNA_ID=CAMNT_0000561175 /DNA_START=32 /DNA_END=757 /DNA_ORIENTATION=+ /assembly_acc=CAM_ASM_000147
MPYTELENKLERSSASSSISPSLASLSSSSSSRSLHSFSVHSSDTNKEATKRVSFSEIDVVELPMILGDHPACRDGLPVQPAWDASDRYSVTVDSFEEKRSPRRRSGSQLYISSFDRLKLIRNVPLRDESSPQTVQAVNGPLQPMKDAILDNVAPLPITSASDDDDDNNNNNNNKIGEKSAAENKGDEIKRLERRLDDANTRFDMLTLRMDDLELIRKKRVERIEGGRQRRRRSWHKLYSL